MERPRTLVILLSVALLLLVAPGQDPRPVVDELIADNHLQGSLQAGQAIELPAPIR